MFSPDPLATNPRPPPRNDSVETRETPSRSRVPAKPYRITVAERDLQEIRTGRFGRIQVLGEEEALYWLQQWREGAKPKEETRMRKIVIRRNRNEACLSFLESKDRVSVNNLVRDQPETYFLNCICASLDEGAIRIMKNESIVASGFQRVANKFRGSS